MDEIKEVEEKRSPLNSMMRAMNFILNETESVKRFWEEEKSDLTYIFKGLPGLLCGE